MYIYIYIYIYCKEKFDSWNWTKNEESGFQFTSFDTFNTDDNEGVEVEVLGMLRLSKYNKGVHSKKNQEWEIENHLLNAKYLANLRIQKQSHRDVLSKIHRKTSKQSIFFNKTVGIKPFHYYMSYKHGSIFSRTGHVKLMEDSLTIWRDMVCLSRSYPLKSF